LVFYYAVSTYHVLCCVLHRLTREPDQKAVLYISDAPVTTTLNLKRYRESGIFDEVHVLEELETRKYSIQLERKKMPIKQVMDKCCKRMQKTVPLRHMQEAETMYIGLDTLPFGWYVAKQKLPYVLFEDGNGILSNKALFMATMRPGSVRELAIEHFGLLGENPQAKAILADTQTQQPGYKNPKMVDFSAKRILAEMNPETRRRVLAFFGCEEKKELPQTKTSLLLTQHLANMNYMPLEQQHKLYLLLADYFLQGQTLVIKPHPDDIAGRYRELFGEDTQILPLAMPSELLPYCVAERFGTVLAASSTSTKSFADMADKALWFEARIHQDFLHMHRYYVAAQLLKQLCPGGRVFTNANHQLLSELGSVQADYTEDFVDAQADCLVISDALEGDLQTNTAIFLNERRRHLYFNGTNQDVFANIRPIVIDKNPEAEEVIYVYSENPEILRKAEEFQHEIALPHCGITLHAQGIGAEERLKIKVLEGMLEATEARLRDYIAMHKKAGDTA